METSAWGANSHGQLGLDRFSEYEFPTRINNLPADLKQIVGGAGHTMIVDESGSLWASGWNSKGQLGNGSTDDICRFIKLELSLKFQNVSCGWDTSAGITTDNRLFVWGSNSQNKLGFSSKERKIIKEPTELELPFGETAIDVKFGLRHSVIFTKSNQIFIFGSFKHFKNVKHKVISHNSCEFLQIVHERKVLQVDSGQNHISFIDDQNFIIGIGDNRFQQCSEVKPTDKVVKLACGWTHNAFLNQSKELFIYGRNNYGQCGNGARSDFEAPQRFPIHPVDDFQLGAEHGIVISKGEVYTWGWNEHGNCGNGEFEDLLKPERLKLPVDGEIVSIVAGSGFCMVSLKKS